MNQTPCSHVDRRRSPSEANLGTTGIVTMRKPYMTGASASRVGSGLSVIDDPTRTAFPDVKMSPWGPPLAPDPGPHPP